MRYSPFEPDPEDYSITRSATAGRGPADKAPAPGATSIEVPAGAPFLPSSAGAMQQGAGVKFFLTYARNGWTLCGRKAFSGCPEIAGRSIAVHSSTGLSAALVRAWLMERCPGTAIQILIIPGSENRAAALMAGRIDLAALELADAIEVDRLRPNEFHRVADFGRELPWLLSFLYIAPADHLVRRREVLKAFTREVLAAYQIAARDPDLIDVAAAKYLRTYEPSTAVVLARAYAGAGLWPVDARSHHRPSAARCASLRRVARSKPVCRSNGSRTSRSSGRC